MPQKSDNKLPSEVPLKEAWCKFASDKLQRAARKSNAKFRSLNARQMNPPHNFESLVNNAQESLANWQEAQRIRDGMQDDVCNKLSSGGLGACRSAAGGQAKKPAFWDNAEIDWDNGKASDDIAHYRRIRVALPEHESVPEQAPAADTSSKRDPGRPPTGHIILAAIEVCDAADPQFSQLRRKLQEQRVREQIKRDRPEVDTEGGGFTPKTIMTYLGRYYKPK